MTTKEQIMRSLDNLPEDATIEDFMERLYFLLKVERGLADVEAGRTISHEELVKRMKEWAK